MKKKVTKSIIFIVLLVIVGMGCFYLGRISMLKDQAELQKRITGPALINPAENIPEANPFKKVELNPFEQGYKNPFKD